MGLLRVAGPFPVARPFSRCMPQAYSDYQCLIRYGVLMEEGSFGTVPMQHHLGRRDGEMIVGRVVCGLHCRKSRPWRCLYYEITPPNVSNTRVQFYQPGRSAKVTPLASGMLHGLI